MNYVPSAAAQVIVTIIPMVGIVMGTVVLFFYILLSYKVKRAMIEKGIYKRPDVDLDTFSIFLGLILSCVGAALLVFFIVKSGITYGLLSGLIPFSIGLSLVSFYVLRNGANRKNG
jgi:hypothetical protein